MGRSNAAMEALITAKCAFIAATLHPHLGRGARERFSDLEEIAAFGDAPRGSSRYPLGVSTVGTGNPYLAGAGASGVFE